MSLFRRRIMMQTSITDELAAAHPELEYSQAGELILHIDYGKWNYTRDYYKVNDGLCIVGCAKYNGYFSPIVVGRTEDSVRIRYDNTYTNNNQIQEFEYANSTWFCVWADGLDMGTFTAHLISDVNYTSVIQAAIDLLNYYYGVI